MVTLKLYKVADDPAVVKKTLTSEVIFSNVMMKEDCDIINPTVRLSGAWNLMGYNYAYIEELNRYYFISNISLDRGDIITMSLSLDVLYTYKDEILNSNQLIMRQEFEQAKYISDEMLIPNVNKDVEVAQFSGGQFNINSATNTSYNFVLSCAGMN